MSDAILSDQEVRSERYRYPDSTTEDGANDVIAPCDPHEALRAELEEAVTLLRELCASYEWTLVHGCHGEPVTDALHMPLIRAHAFVTEYDVGEA